MKRTNHPVLFLIVLALMTVLLAACVRPVPTPDVSPVPTAVPQPTLDLATPVPAQPTAQPDGAYPAQETTPEPTAVPTADPNTSTDPNTGQTIHTIQPGDTLYSIAQQYGTTIDAIVTANGIADPNNVPVGTPLVIPKPGEVVSPPTDGGTTDGGTTTGETVHVVQAGENLFRIGLNYGFTAAELAAYNGIADPTRIYVGQQIRIPPR